MKKIAYILSLLALLIGSVSLSAQESKQYAIYNYRNDGDFDAFMNADIDSITYSCFDLDSVEHEDIVVQEVWTPYQVYRIPIEAIDSIGFHAPETKYQERVFFIREEHVPYVKGIDDLNITFDASTPTNMLPSVGQVLVTETSEGILDDGFAGRVTNIRNTSDGIEYVCEEVSLSDIFEQVTFVSKCSTEGGMDEAACKAYMAKAPRRSIFDGGIGIDEVIKIDLDEVKCSYSEDGEKLPIEFRYKPEMDITCLISVIKDHPAVAKVTFHHSHSLYLKAKYEAEWGDSKEWWFSKKDIRIHIPIAAVDAVLKPYVNFGAFVDWSGSAKFEYELPLLKFEQTFGLDYSEYRSEENRVQFINETEFVHDDPSISLSLDGSLAFGLAMKIGAKLIHKKLLNCEAVFHVGPEFKGHFELSTDHIGEDANLYRQLRNSTIELDGYVAITEASYQFCGSGVKLAKRGTWKGAKWSNKIPKTEDLLPNDKYPNGYMIDWPIKTWHVVPDFEAPEVRTATATSAKAEILPSRNLLFPVRLGMAFKSYQTGEVIEQDYGSYWGEKNNDHAGSAFPWEKTFDNLTESSTYKVYPTVTLLGLKMNAEPSVDYTVPGKLIVTPTELTIKAGETGEVRLIGGSGGFDYTTDDAGIANGIYFDHRFNAVSLIIQGVGVGDTYITITDIHTSVSIRVLVHVVDTNFPTLTLSVPSLTVNALTTNAVQITSGSGSYSAVSDHPEIAEASVSGSTIAIEAYAAGTATITVTDTQSGQTATIAVTVIADDEPTTDAVAVDLGLPSGTKWADRNVGASSPEDYGGYYAWGETEEKAVYDWSTYKWCNGSYNTQTKYCTDSSYGTVDNKTVLDPEDDVAHVKWGGAWKMPTLDQVEELLDNCSSEWTTVNGVKGRKFTSKINGNSIFLPAAGYRSDSGLYRAGSGYFWSSTLFEGGPNYAYDLDFDSGRAYCDINGRSDGFSVRPVISGTISSNLTLSTTTVSLKVGDSSSTVEITAGSGNYTIVSDMPSVATANLSGTTITITPKSAGTATITVTDTQSGQTAMIAATVIADDNPTTDAVAVDLGLPSGTKWADRNVGASSPEDYGGYYAWGETEEKAVYDWSTYKWCNGDWVTHTKYCTKSSYGTVDNKTVLDPEDDVAHVKWGGAWKMPTLDQVKELLDNCTSEWTTQNGVEGRKFTSKINGNSIFLPAAGWRDGSDLYDAGSGGIYWSSSLHESYPGDAFFLYSHSDLAGWDNCTRPYGYTVRPVR